MIRAYAIFSVIILSGVFSPALAKDKSCVNFPSLMLGRQAGRSISSPAIFVEGFSNFTKLKEDDWLIGGIRDYLFDLLTTSQGVDVIKGPANFSGTPNYVVKGSFQHAGWKLRVFVSVHEGAGGKLIKQMDGVFNYPDNAGFFIRIADISREILKIAGVKPPDEAINSVRDATISTRAYESYSKGMQILESYSIPKLEVASVWFMDAKRIDYRSPLGYLGLAELYSVLGLFNKLNGRPFASFFEKAEGELNVMKRLANLPPKNRKWDQGNRFLAANAAYLAGVAAEKEKSFSNAAASFKRAVTWVPEDAVAMLHLSRALLGLGNKPAAEDAMHKASAMNECID